MNGRECDFGAKCLPSHPWKAPQGRFRGKRKYFRQVLRRAEAFRLDTGPDEWWDHWHYHADWTGWGNLCWSYRLEHLRALVVVFRHILRASSLIAIPFQTWMALDPDDASNDAVFLHSPNPNRSTFPIKLDATWGVDGLGEVVRALLPDVQLRAGRCSWLGEDGDGVRRTRTTFLAYSPGSGVPLE